jgi:hypothetical protein
VDVDRGLPISTNYLIGGNKTHQQLQICQKEGMTAPKRQIGLSEPCSTLCPSIYNKQTDQSKGIKTIGDGSPFSFIHLAWPRQGDSGRLTTGGDLPLLAWHLLKLQPAPAKPECFFLGHLVHATDALIRGTFQVSLVAD